MKLWSYIGILPNFVFSSFFGNVQVMDVLDVTIGLLGEQLGTTVISLQNNK